MSLSYFGKYLKANQTVDGVRQSGHPLLLPKGRVRLNFSLLSRYGISADRFNDLKSSSRQNESRGGRASAGGILF
ncbi:MAG: hypothetical protein U1E27_00495 [Kiritimatiellia bacterium]|nr:hypothetical protein [Kiritimatiellia bacterium]